LQSTCEFRTEVYRVVVAVQIVRTGDDYLR
jgi:hypothetical protein